MAFEVVSYLEISMQSNLFIYLVIFLVNDARSIGGQRKH